MGFVAAGLGTTYMYTIPYRENIESYDPWKACQGCVGLYNQNYGNTAEGNHLSPKSWP